MFRLLDDDERDKRKRAVDSIRLSMRDRMKRDYDGGGEDDAKPMHKALDEDDKDFVSRAMDRESGREEEDEASKLFDNPAMVLLLKHARARR